MFSRFFKFWFAYNLIASGRISALQRLLFAGLPQQKAIYHSLISSYFDYCSLISCCFFIIRTSIDKMQRMSVLTFSIAHNWEPSLILKNCHCRVKYFHQLLIYPTLRNNYFEVNMVKLSIWGGGLWKCLMSAFHHFLQPLFQNDQRWPIIPNFSLLTWYIVTNKYVRLQNCLLLHV